MPLYLCPVCGWTTTASLEQAARAHALGVPDCEGILDLVAYAGKPTGRNGNGRNGNGRNGNGRNGTAGAAGSGRDTESDPVRRTVAP